MTVRKTIVMSEIKTAILECLPCQALCHIFSLTDLTSVRQLCTNETRT